ncbi:MAG: outer membrane protein transport protein, partial [Pseudomonadota bacterium]|nr:outer membrane protein transport protein [Pseudomonadota bacterium]
WRSPVELNLEGDLRLQAPSGALPAGSYPIQAGITLPEIVTIGLRHQLTSQLELNAGFEWTNWSRLGTVPVVSTAGPATGATLTNLYFEYDDGYYASLGAEYDFNERWSMRGGLAYEWSPISTSTRDLRLPDADRLHAALGASYTWKDRLTVDLAYTHIFTMGDGDIELTPGNPSYITGLPFVGSVDSGVDLISLGASYRF